MTCPRCRRNHSGICGIPPGVTRGYGARRIVRGTEGQTIGGKPGNAKPGTAVLEKLLADGQEQYKKVQSMLKVIPYDLPEYAELIDRESKLDGLIKQLYQQIAIRRMK